MNFYGIKKIVGLVCYKGEYLVMSPLTMIKY